MVVIALALIVPGVRTAAWAQAGWYLTPSLRLSESFDDNIFATSTNRESDFITRITPGLDGGYRSDPFTLTANGAFESDIFAKNPQLNDPTTGWNAGVNLQYLPTRNWTLGLNINYLETKSLTSFAQGLININLQNPLNPANTIQFGRQRTTLLSALGSAAYQITPRTSATGSFGYTYSTLEGGATNTAYTTQLGLSHQITAVDTGTFNYLNNVFDSPGSPTSVVNSPTIGWIRQFSPVTMLNVSAGPSFVEGSVYPNVNALLTHQFKIFDIVANASLRYSYYQGFVVGEAGAQNTQNATATLTAEPIRSLLLSLVLSASKSDSISERTVPTVTTYGVALVATYQILKWLSARASYTYYYQEQSGGNIPHSVLSLGLEASYPIRVDQ
jgi:hypothetical protein